VVAGLQVAIETAVGDSYPPSTAGLGAWRFGWRERGRTLEHERRINDVGAVRDVIEEGAVALHRDAYTLDDLRGPSSRSREDVYAALREFGQRYDELSERMRVRLGPEHEVTRKFVGAGEAVLDIFRALGLMGHEEPAEEEWVRRDVARFMDEQWQRIDAAYERFDQHSKEFIAAAARLAAAKL
jgi:hypothetical protein